MPTRRANHEGKIQRLPSGKYRAVMMVDGQWKAGPAVKLQKDALPALRQKLAGGSPSSISLASTSLQDFVSSAIETAESTGRIQPTTAQLKRYLLGKHLQGTPFGELDLLRVDQASFDAWLAGVPGGKHTRRNVAILVASALRDRGVRLSYVAHKAPSTKARVLEPRDRKSLLKAARGQERTLIALLLLMGLRRGEALGVMAGDRDQDGVHLRRQVVRVKGRILVKELKTRTSETWVPLPRWLRVHWPAAGYVLANADGEPMSPEWANETVAAVAARAGLGHLSPHDLRHTYAMHLLESGVDLRTASEMLRNDPAVLARIYAQSRRDLKRAALARVQSR